MSRCHVIRRPKWSSSAEIPPEVSLNNRLDSLNDTALPDHYTGSSKEPSRGLKNAAPQKMISYDLWLQVDEHIQSLNRAQLLTHPHCPDYFLERGFNGFSPLPEHGYADTHFDLIKRLLINAKDDSRHPEKTSPLITQVVYLRIASLYSVEDEETMLASKVPAGHYG